jgi:hypothetical protein
MGRVVLSGSKLCFIVQEQAQLSSFAGDIPAGILQQADRNSNVTRNLTSRAL